MLSYKRDELNELLHMLSQRLGDKGKNWRHVLKVCNFVFAVV